MDYRKLRAENSGHPHNLRENSDKIGIPDSEIQDSHKTRQSGDFNLNPQHPAYQRLSTAQADAGHASRKPSAELSTFNAFGQPMATNPGKIDHIFLRGPVKVAQQQIDQRRYLGLYPSDHYPVIADLLLE